MSSCQGELPNKDFDVMAVDQDGHLLIDGTVSTLRNGFLELWLPRNLKIELTIQGMNRAGKETIETFDDSNTCITTFRLHTPRQ
jgi:hypothetical protein